jgi:hypothetical protein
MIANSWLSEEIENIQPVFFVGGDREQWLDSHTVMVEAPDDYAHLPQKIRKFFEFCLRNFDFEWIFKCDDDTYVAMDRLHSLISADHDIIGSPYLDERGSPSGGAGYFLTREMVRRLVADATLASVGDEDVIHGEAVIRYGARALGTHRLRMDASDFPRSDNDLVTAHWCSEARLEIIHSIRTGTGGERIPIKHPFWSDEVVLYEDGSFMRTGTRCHGRWHGLKGGIVILDWLDWPAEVFIRTTDNGSGRGEGKETLIFQHEMLGHAAVKKDTPNKRETIYVEEDWSGERKWRVAEIPKLGSPAFSGWKKDSVYCISLSGVIDQLELGTLRELLDDSYKVLKAGSFLRVEFLDLSKAVSAGAFAELKGQSGSSEARKSLADSSLSGFCPAAWTEDQITALMRASGFVVQPAGLGWSAFGDIRDRMHWISKEWTSELLPLVCYLEAMKLS